MDANFLILKWNKIEEKLNNEQLNIFYDLISIIDREENENDDLHIIPKNEMDIINSQRKGKREKRERLVKALLELQQIPSTELAHVEADELLIRYIDSKEVERAFDAINKDY